MSILEKIERKIPWFGFGNLNLYMVVIFLVGLMIDIVNPTYYYLYLSLNLDAVMSGQIYRLITFIFYPPTSSYSLIMALLMIYVYYSITKTLILMWGNFKFNLYLFIGYISQVIGAFILHFVFKNHSILYPTYVTFSLIVAFALSFPDATFFIYFLIPIKAIYFAYFEIVVYFIMFLFTDISGRVSIICGAVNIFVFFVLLKNKI